jgi:CRP/FNR family transcriptional regulator
MTSNVALSGVVSRFARPSLCKPESRPDYPDIIVRTAGTEQVRTLKAGESLFLQGDKVRWIWMLREGWAFRYQSMEDGRRQIVDFVLPHDILGVGTTSQMPYGAEALTGCTWTAMSRDGVLARLSQDPALSMSLVNMLSAGQARAFDQMTSLGRRTARERVAHLLFDLAKRARICVADGEKVAMPIMLAHIGDALGLATETVCRCLGELKRAGILIFSAGRLQILDPDGLSKLVGPGIEDEEVEDQARRLVA